MLASEPLPPPPRKPAQSDRALQTLLQTPREARGSRTSAIVLSVVVHLALFLVLRKAFWQPIALKSGPVFQVFQLSPPEKPPSHIPSPFIEPPAVAPTVVQVTPPAATQPQINAPQSENVLAQPSAVPGVIPPPGSPVAEPSLTGSPAQPLSAAERLRRSTLSPGLTALPPVTYPAPLTPQEAADARMYAGIKAYNDSIAGAAVDAAKATDWTKTDKNGGRWGVSPGQLHLGSVTIPLPFQFSGPAGRRDETNARLRSFAESNAQANRMEMEQTFESRVKAMRARKNAERDSAKVAKTAKTGH